MANTEWESDADYQNYLADAAKFDTLAESKAEAEAQDYIDALWEAGHYDIPEGIFRDDDEELPYYEPQSNFF